jgi:hypothetical protein
MEEGYPDQLYNQRVHQRSFKLFGKNCGLQKKRRATEKTLGESTRNKSATELKSNNYEFDIIPPGEVAEENATNSFEWYLRLKI